MNNRSLFFWIVMLFVTQSDAKTVPEDYYRNFWYPTYHVQPLNYCTLNEKSCGITVANRYCQIMGYEKSVQNIKENNVGLTTFIESKSRCTGWRCHGFRLIRCVKKMQHLPPKIHHYRAREFARPRFEHYRVAWCYEDNKHCGQRVADSFCRRMGYMRAKNFTLDKQGLATKALGNHKLCFGSMCKAFKRIQCYR